MPLHYKWHYSEMLHGDILNKFVNAAFYERGYDAILIMDIDCIPLSRKAIDITLNLAYQGKLVGNAQRSCHIENGNHIYAASSFVCFSEETYSDMGRPNMLPNRDGDTCEQVTYNFERLKNWWDLILYWPSKIDSPNEKGEYWNLDTKGSYGIGTTFEYQNVPMSYHLFGSRLGLWNELFFRKCEEVLNENSGIHNL